MPDNDPIDQDFAALPEALRAEIEGAQGVGLHHAPLQGAPDSDATGAAFHHPEKDGAGTVWEPNWEPIDTYTDSDVVMLDDGNRQILGRRDTGLWMELLNGDEIAQPDFRPMLWSYAPEQVKYDMM